MDRSQVFKPAALAVAFALLFYAGPAVGVDRAAVAVVAVVIGLMALKPRPEHP